MNKINFLCYWFKFIFIIKKFQLHLKKYELQQVYKDDGSEFSGASIGVIFEENILVGSPIGDLMECHKN